MNSPGLPSYWLAKPTLEICDTVVEQLEQIYARAIEGGHNGWIEAELPIPNWQFLCWLTDSKGHLLHGTGDPAIKLFEPRQSNDIAEFGNRKAVYAASDGIWAMFFAITDRSQYQMTIVNAAIRLELPDGIRQSYYFFSMSDQVLAQKPWREGVVYVLPKFGFEEEQGYQRQGIPIHTNHWACLEPVTPLAKLRIRPQDFPFLAQVNPHNDELLGQRVEANPNGFPWFE